jgi:hypothetical protein
MRGVTIVLLVLISACAAQRPVLYPNRHFEQAGSGAAQRAIGECMRQADAYLASGNRAAQVAGQAVVGAGSSAAVGAAAGAAGGAVVGHATRGAAVGAAGAGAAGMTRGLLQGLFRKRGPDPTYKNFVNRCLREKGYDPIGWS